MNIDQLISVNKTVWKNYLNRISKLRLENGLMLFPKILLITEVNNFFIIELLGATKSFEEIVVKKHKATNVESYLFQFNYDEKIQPKDTNEIDTFGITRILFGSLIEEEMIRTRFSFQNRWGSGIVTSHEDLSASSFFNFSKGINFMEFNDCCIVNKLENVYRLKSIIHLHVVSKKITKPNYKKYLLNTLTNEIVSTNDVKGALFSDSIDVETNILYSQFLNIYSFSSLRETTIGEFLNKNPSILKKAFDLKSFEYEPELEWLEGNPEEDENSINPDFLIQRDDGYWDILDIKLPYWSKQKLTKSKRKRRSFLQIVDDAISQLANYEDYFNFDKNKLLAEKKYGVKINNPKLIIVIGNYNNYDKTEIQEASRKLKDNFMIIDYDTLNLKFYNSSINFA